MNTRASRSRTSSNLLRDVIIIAGVLLLTAIVYTVGYSIVRKGEQNELARSSKAVPVAAPTGSDLKSIIQAGDDLMDAERYPEAVSHYSRALQLDSTNTDVMVDRGACYYSLKEYDLAMLDFKTALGLSPSHKIAHFNLGVLYGALGEDSLRIVHWRKYIELDPNGDMAEQVRAYLKRSEKQP